MTEVILLDRAKLETIHIEQVSSLDGRVRSGGTSEYFTYSLGEPMRYKSLLLASILVATTAYAKEPKAFQSGKLVQMDSVKCGVDEKDAKSFAGEMIGTDSGHKKTEELLCQEYVLQTDKMIYRIRPKDAKHPVLLPVGEQAQFRMDKDKLLLRVEDLDSKEREYIVVSMTPRADSTANATSAPLNHVQ
jgi:hypothetical protein